MDLYDNIIQKTQEQPNIDTLFNDSIDALLIARISDFPENEVLPLMRTTL